MKRLVAAFCLSCAFAYPSAGLAQLKPEPPIGTRIPQPLEVFPTDRSRPVVRRFADCSVKKRYNLAREMILSARDYYIPDKDLKVADQYCLGEAVQGLGFSAAELRMSNGVWRFAVADALVARDLASYDPAGITTAAPLSQLVYNPEDLSGSPGRLSKEDAAALAKGEIELVRYGECVVRADPVGSARLLASKINSDDENARLNAMMGAFRGCLDQGRQFQASRTLLRGTVAFNFYRLAYAPKTLAPVATSAGKAK